METMEMLDKLEARIRAATERAEKAELAVQEQRLLTETVRAGMQSIGRALEDCRLDKHAVEVVRDRMSKCVTDAITRAEAAEAERNELAKRNQEWKETADNYAAHCGKACDQIEKLEADLTAARAGEARALEALRKIHEGAARQLAEPRNRAHDQYTLTVIATECESVFAAQESALGWLAQQRREAVAEALKEVAKLIRQTNRTPYGGDVAPFEIGKWEGRQYAAEQIENRAAELRKGKGE